MLYMPPNSSMPVRVHGAFVRDEEVHAVVQDWKARGRPQYIDSILSSSEDGEGGLGLDSDEELIRYSIRPLPLLLINVVLRFPVFSDNSVLVITVRLVLLNRWKLRVL